MTTRIPHTLNARPFTVDEALNLGISERVLEGNRFRRLYKSVYVRRDLEVSHAVRIEAAALALPHAYPSHVTGLRRLECDIGPTFPLHFTTPDPIRTRLPGLFIHRADEMPPIEHGSIIPEACWVGSALQLSTWHLIIAGDWLPTNRHTTLERLHGYVDGAHGVHGVRLARHALTFVRERVESPQETVVRLAILRAGLPEPVCNINIYDGECFLGRGDLVYREFRIVIEYDGRQHLTDLGQWEHDVARHEGFHEAGWIVIRVTNAQLASPNALIRRIHRALVSCGYRGPAPRLA